MPSNTTASIYNSHFSKWTPFVGVYIAVATFVCVAAITIDLVGGLRTKQYWIPPNRSSLSAVSITIIAAASKLSLDISTSMPRQIDQLTKLSTTAFVCIALAIITPSIGKLGKGNLLSNIAALSVFVISSVVSICIQLKTGVIFTFRAAHTTMIVMICIILVKCILSSMTLPLFKSTFSSRYNTMHQKAKQALHDDEHRKHPTNEKLKKYLEKISMMAHSGCPRFLMARLATSVIYTLCGLVAALAFSTVLIACITHKDKFLGPSSRSGTSNYDWSAVYILIIQTIGVGLGTIVLCIRGSYTVAMQSGKLDSASTKEHGNPEEYWKPGSELFGGTQFFSFIEYSEGSWLNYLLIYPFYTACAFLQALLSLVDLALFWLIPLIFWACMMKMRKPGPSTDRPQRQRNDNPAPEEPTTYFFQWYTEHLRTEIMMNSIQQVTNYYFDAKERETSDLRELVESCSEGFERVVKFQIPPIPEKSTPRPPGVWSLSVLTLTWIAIVLPGIERNSKDKLRKGVIQSLVYVKLIEDSFNNKEHFFNFRLAAEILCLGLFRMRKIRFCLRWIFRLDVGKLFFGDISAKETIEFVKDGAMKLFTALTSTGLRAAVPQITAGAHYAYGACEMILQDCQNDRAAEIFEKVSGTISDILGACLINLKYYILRECEPSSSSIEKRREAVCRILKLFGETKEIMEILDKKKIPEDIPAKKIEEMVDMDNWHQCGIEGDVNAGQTASDGDGESIYWE